MISKLHNYLQILKSNLWFFPAFVCFLYAAATMGLYYLESTYFSDIELPGMIFNGTAEDAKALAVTLLSSMITMSTLAISITMVVLSLAASQLGPRLIKTFMSDNRTKTFIALFFGSVVACFILTMVLHDITAKDATPQVTVTAVFVICFSNLFVLLAFVHHVALSSIADQVILQVTKDLHASVSRLTNSEDDEEEEPEHEDWPKDFDRKRHRIYFKRSGYVQHIDYKSIMAILEEHGLYIEIHFKAGHFLVVGEDGVRIYPNNKVSGEIDTAIRECFIIGNARTPTQDVEYSIRHLVEIGLRAQSPSLDDNFTAIIVLDHLSAAMAELFQKATPLEWSEDSEGRVRMWARQSSEAHIIFSAFDQMRHSAREKPDIVYHLLKKLKILCELARTKSQREGLHKQLTQIKYDLDYIDRMVLDIEDMKRMCQDLLNYLNEKE